MNLWKTRLAHASRPFELVPGTSTEADLGVVRDRSHTARRPSVRIVGREMPASRVRSRLAGLGFYCLVDEDSPLARPEPVDVDAVVLVSPLPHASVERTAARIRASGSTVPILAVEADPGDGAGAAVGPGRGVDGVFGWPGEADALARCLSRLVVEAPGRRADDIALEERIRHRRASAAWPFGDRLRVMVHDRMAHLRGAIEDPRLLPRARAIVTATPGIVEIVTTAVLVAV
jgi:hypothetical protein